jgi:hypothetical protein
LNRLGDRSERGRFQFHRGRRKEIRWSLVFRGRRWRNRVLRFYLHDGCQFPRNHNRRFRWRGRRQLLNNCRLRQRFCRFCRFLGARVYEIRGRIVGMQVKIGRVGRGATLPTDNYCDKANQENCVRKQKPGLGAKSSWEDVITARGEDSATYGCRTTLEQVQIAPWPAAIARNRTSILAIAARTTVAFRDETVPEAFSFPRTARYD